MKDRDTIDNRIKLVANRKKIYFFLGWPMLALGMGILFSGRWRAIGIGCIVVGVLVRTLYYFTSSELRSLEKYRHLIDKSKLLIILSFICFSFHFNLAGQLKRGDDASEFSGVEWIKGEPLKLLNEESSPSSIRVIEFWASWDKASQLSFPLLSKVQSKYGRDKIVVIALTKEKQEKVEKYLGTVKDKIKFRIAVDSKGEVTRKYIGDGGGIPYIFIIDKNNEILWCGQPLDLEAVLEKIFKGTFDAAVQEKISYLHTRLQENMQMERLSSAVRIIDDIMKLDPSDALAMRVRLYIFERLGKLSEALPFIDKLIDKSPESSSLYFVKLDVMDRLNKSPEDIRAFCREIFTKFNKSPDVLEHLAWIAVYRMPVGSAPIETALDSIDKAVAMFFESGNENPAKLANYLETQGRVYYMIGRIAKALELQEKVINFREDDKRKSQAKLLKDYYKKVLELKNR